ncbi:MAG: radical SAM protein [Candidatus Gracilibacteria bacterium]|nr:radical SAM protein [Candidatus Gracilibacteria bacterium]
MENKQNLLSKEKTTKQNRVWVRITAACNNKCLFCLDSDAQNGVLVKEDIVKEEIKKGFKQGYENRVIISGGEASINPKFNEYIKYARELGYNRVQTVTNGNMFHSFDFCKKVVDAGLQEITFSFHGHNSTLHDYLVATPGAFNRSIKGLLNIKKYFPEVIVNIDIVVNKVNVRFLPDIVKFFMKFGVYEYDILQIIPFGRGFKEYKSKLFYNISDNIEYLQKTWELSKVPGMYMWTNRFPAEAFEGYEDLIQDPRKMKSEVMGEAYSTFEKFIKSDGKIKPNCYGDACSVCFQKDYCHSFIENINTKKLDFLPLSMEVPKRGLLIILGEEFPSQVYEKYGDKIEDFKNKLKSYNKKLINIPKCLGGSGIYQTYNDIKEYDTLEDYTYKYINNLYRIKSLNCKKCKYDKECKGIHINFVRSYGFKVLESVI